MPSAGNYNRLITVQKADRNHVSAGTQELWADVRTVKGSCEYVTDLFKPQNQQEAEGEATWVIRTRSDPMIGRKASGYRFLVQINGELSAFYPKSFPILKSNEWRIDCTENEDIPAAALVGTGGNW